MGAQEDSYSAVGFLPNSESDDEEQTPLPQHHPKGLSKLQRLHLAGLYLIIVLFIVFTLMTRSTSRGPVLFIKDAFYSPAQDVIEYETFVYPENFINKGPYMTNRSDGFPTADTDSRWDELYNIGVTWIGAEAASKIPNATRPLPDDPDRYIVELDVFHQIHCLNSVRKALYRERYKNDWRDLYKNGEFDYTSVDANHLDHCIDHLRRSVMCHSDIATVYWKWSQYKRVPLPSLQVTHTCRKFERIQQWAREHNLSPAPKWIPGPPPQE